MTQRLFLPTRTSRNTHRKLITPAILINVKKFLSSSSATLQVPNDRRLGRSKFRTAHRNLCSRKILCLLFPFVQDSKRSARLLVHSLIHPHRQGRFHKIRSRIKPRRNDHRRQSHAAIVASEGSGRGIVSIQIQPGIGPLPQHEIPRILPSHAVLPARINRRLQRLFIRRSRSRTLHRPSISRRPRTGRRLAQRRHLRRSAHKLCFPSPRWPSKLTHQNRARKQPEPHRNRPRPPRRHVRTRLHTLEQSLFSVLARFLYFLRLRLGVHGRLLETHLG